jgi:hypothetical protein
VTRVGKNTSIGFPRLRPCDPVLPTTRPDRVPNLYHRDSLRDHQHLLEPSPCRPGRQGGPRALAGQGAAPDPRHSLRPFGEDLSQVRTSNGLADMATPAHTTVSRPASTGPRRSRAPTSTPPDTPTARSRYSHDRFRCRAPRHRQDRRTPHARTAATATAISATAVGITPAPALAAELDNALLDRRRGHAHPDPSKHSALICAWRLPGRLMGFRWWSVAALSGGCG